MSESVSDLFEIPPGTFGVLGVDPNTGVLVDSEGKWITSGVGDLVSFDSLQEATAYCEARVIGEVPVDLFVYDERSDQIAVFRSRPTTPPTSNPTKPSVLKRLLGWLFG